MEAIYLKHSQPALKTNSETASVSGSQSEFLNTFKTLMSDALGAVADNGKMQELNFKKLKSKRKDEKNRTMDDVIAQIDKLVRRVEKNRTA